MGVTGSALLVGVALILSESWSTTSQVVSAKLIEQKQRFVLQRDVEKRIEGGTTNRKNRFSRG